MVATLRRRVDNLPVELTSFVGRRRELAEVRRLLTCARLLTLTGVGGVGKTRLALRTAAELRRAFPDGVALVELAELKDAELVAGEVAAVLGLDADAAGPPWPVLRDFLASKRLLLILDNCEHLLDSCAELAGSLLSSAEGLCILATSRQPLGIAGEHTLAVPSLTVPEPASAPTLSMLDQYDAVSLFVERAGAILTNFAVTEANCEPVVRLCQQLDGIPLAIELAAARLRAFSVQQILERLSDRFTLLTAGNRIALPRQQTLRALIDWSYRLCSEPERVLWSRLSVFAGGFELEAAESVCGGDGLPGPEVFELLAGLVEKSIVVRVETGSRVDYRMLETIRRYGQDRLAENGEETELRRRHRDWFTRLAESAETGWAGPNQVEWYQRIRAETANLRLALDFCLAEPGESQAALELATALCNHRRACSSLGEGRRWLDRVLAAAPQPCFARAKGLWVSAWLALLQGDRAAAGRLLTECRDLAERIEDPSAVAHAIQFAGLAELFDADFCSAIELLEDAFNRHRALGSLPSQHVTYGQLTMALCFAGDPRAAANVATCLSMIDAETSPVPHAYALWYAATERFMAGDPSAASARAAQALRVEAASADRWLMSLCLETLAWTACALGEPVRSARLLGAAEAIRHAMGSALAGLGHLRRAHDECERTARLGLGDERFLAAYRKGLAIDGEQAVVLALQDKASTAGVRPAGATVTALTRREREIAELVAKGMSNKEIAATLVIAQRTAETHVEHILTKLGFSRRTQIAAWATENRASAAS